MIKLINDDFRRVVPTLDSVRMIFADPPDNIGLKYKGYKDNLAGAEYATFLRNMIWTGTAACEVMWISYNSRYTNLMGYLLVEFLMANKEWESKSCVQTFTFGQHNSHDLGSNHRPLVRLMRTGTELYPDAVRVPSWRQLNGDKRADPRGRVPGDVFDYPRVTGNSGQRRKWHPTQLHEGLYQRCIRLTCKPTDTVCDIFAGTGTMARACDCTENPCVLIELDPDYCAEIAKEHGLTETSSNTWERQDA
jgi:DNA modification methylase